jgi:serine/threonine protein kinase
MGKGCGADFEEVFVPKQGAQLPGLEWDPRGKVLAQGSNKSIFSGSFHGEKAAVCLADANEKSIKRTRNEVEVLKAIGRHPAIIEMLACGMHEGTPYLVLEQVEPVGFDLARLSSQYALVGAKVPARLCGRLYKQMVGGLQHMHGKGILHLDLKTTNVLVTLGYNAKLCDFGVACKVGTVYRLVAGYMSPELCQGKDPLGPPADYWGMGLILHQMYQGNEWNLVETHELEQGGTMAKLRDGIPGKRSMPGEVRQVMEELIREDPTKRMTLEGMLVSSWLSKNEAEFQRRSRGSWIDIPRASPEPSKWLVPYQGSSRPLTLLVSVGSRQRQLFCKTLEQLGLGNDFPDPENPVVTMLVRELGGGREMISLPSRETVVDAGTQLFLGIPPDSPNSEKAVQFVEEQLGHHSEASGSGHLADSDELRTSMTAERLIKSHHLHEGDSCKRQVVQRGAMHSFVMDFDCFVFPPHIGDEATVGPKPMVGPSGQFAEVKHIALDLRKNFNISLAGIQRVGKTEVEWFPVESDVVRPGDIGLIARCPWQDGSTQSSISPDTLSKLLVEDEFHTIIQKASDQQAASDGVAMNSKSDRVRLYKQPVDAKECVGEIPNGTNVKVMECYSDFLLVKSTAGSGWVGRKNVHAIGGA